MPNWCNFSIKVKGEQKNVAAFDKVMRNSASPTRVHTDGFLPRVLEVEQIDSTGGDATYGGLCAWSVHTCMMDAPDCYPTRWKRDDVDGKFSGVTSLPELAEKLKLEIEVFSNEFGMDFAEYYRIASDGTVEDDLEKPLMPWPEDEEEQVEFDPTDGVVFGTSSGMVPYGAFTI